MPPFNQQEFIDFADREGVINFSEQKMRLVSGIETHWYVDWGPTVADVYSCEKLVSYILDFAENKGLRMDCFYGIPEGATPLAMVANLFLAHHTSNFGPGTHTLPMGRSNPKGHGKPEDKWFIAPPRGRVCLLEDTNTTGDSFATKGMDRLQGLSGVEPVSFLSLTNRLQRRPDGRTVEEFLRGEFSLPYYWMSSGPDLLKRAYARQRESLGDQAEPVARSIDEEYAGSGIELKLL